MNEIVLSLSWFSMHSKLVWTVLLEKFNTFLQTGGYTVANYIWDLMQARNIIPQFPAVEAYYKGLKVSLLPYDALVTVSFISDLHFLVDQFNVFPKDTSYVQMLVNLIKALESSYFCGF